MIKEKSLNTLEIKKDFPLLNESGDFAYLDNAATTQRPVQVIEAMNRFYFYYNSNVHRGIYRISEQATEEYERAHEKAASLINAEKDEIIFTKNATESLNLLAYTLTAGMKRGEEIVLTKMEHHSNLVPWQQMAKRKGLSLKFINVNKEGELENWERIITEKTRIVSVTHVSNVLGTVNPVKEIGEFAKSMGAVFVIDGAQSVPHMKTDVKKLGCDFLAWSGHKMLGPTGIGVLFGKKEILEKIPPFLYGGDMIKEVNLDYSEWNEIPWKFEAGTPNIAEAIGLSAAIDYITKTGQDAIEFHQNHMAKYATDILSEIKGIEIYGPEKKSGIVSFNIKGIHAHDVAALLDREGIAIRGGHHCAMPLMKELGIIACARASFYIYNGKNDIEKLAQGLEKAKKVFGV